MIGESILGLCRNVGRLAGLLILLAGLMVAGCAPRGTVVPESEITEAEASAVWTAFEKYSEARGQEQGPYRVRGSLRYGKEGDTRRVSLLFWSNGTLPIRLDVLAGVNSIAARLLESPDLFVAYVPSEEKALVHKGYERIQLNFGKPVPFSLRDFSALMRGRFHEVFGSAEGVQPSRTKEGNLSFLLDGGLQEGELELQPDGLPVRWSVPESWSMTISYDDEIPPLPYKIRLEHPDGYTAILLVKDREAPQIPFTVEQLSLDLPEGTAVEPVRKMKKTR